MRWWASGGRTGQPRELRKDKAMEYKVIIATLKPTFTDKVVDAARAALA